MRYEKTVNGTLTQYYYNGSRLQAEKRGSNFIYYLYGPDGVAGMVYNGQYYFYEKNIVGDVIGIFNSSGAKVASYDYDAWGNVIAKSGIMADINAFRYRSYYYDVETGFYYLNTRYYDPEMRRFINADNYELLAQLSGTFGQINMYNYCNNNPVMYTDSTGEGIVLILLLAGAILGGVINGAISYSNGVRDWELVQSILVGAAAGVAIAGMVSLLWGVGAIMTGMKATAVILGSKVSVMLAAGSVASTLGLVAGFTVNGQQWSWAKIMPDIPDKPNSNPYDFYIVGK